MKPTTGGTSAPSLQRRLLSLVLGVVSLVWVAAVAVTWRDVNHELDELLDAHLAQAAALLVVQQAAGPEHEDDRAPDAPSLHRYAPRAVFQVFHAGELVLRSADAPIEPMLPLDRDGRAALATTRIGDTEWRVFAARGAEHDVEVLVAERMDSRRDIVWAALRGALWPVALALPLIALLAGVAIHLGLRPLRTLRDQLVARDGVSLQPLALRAAPSEIVPLVEALNALFARIGGLLDSERRFTADAAHELRTPIAAIRAQAQVALAEHDDAARAHALRATLEGCDRATRLVEQLLTLSRLEAEPGTAPQAVDLASIAREVVAALAPQAAARGQELGLDAPPHCARPGDPTLLAVLLRNLVDNAIRYSPPGATIAVGVHAADGAPWLSVEDSGPGIDDALRSRLGQRFQRGLGSDASGSGLGWSIVQRIAAAHDLTWELGRSPTLGGLAVVLRPRRADR